MKKILSLFIYLSFFSLYSQEAILTGLILDDQNLPINDVNIKFNDKGSISDENGFYKIVLEADKEIDIVFSHINHKQLKISVELLENEILEFNPILNTKFEQISEVILNSFTRAELKSILSISPEKLRNITANYNHIFEQPTLFYATVIYIYLMNHGDMTNIVLSWGYVVFRSFHTIIQLTVNNVSMRVIPFIFSGICLILLIVKELLFFF